MNEHVEEAREWLRDAPDPAAGKTRRPAMSEHRMIAGSHERRTGPVCVCGGVWNYWSDKCESEARERIEVGDE